jgi:NAD(P)-dependent dehydrogenase (short-subunit alcohol dehydrogenase family)
MARLGETTSNIDAIVSLCAVSDRYIVFGIMIDNKQVVLITGTSSGFGRLTAELLARQGYRVFATMRNIQGKNAAAASALRNIAAREDLRLDVDELDVTRDDSVEPCVRDIIGRSGRIDVLVNNAGFGYLGLMESFTIDQAQRIFDTNVFGALRTIRAVLPQMHKQGSGLLIQVSSGAGRIVLPAMGLYCATKFALEAITEAYRYELAAGGIDAVSIQPGAYPTDVFGNLEAGVDSAREQQYDAAREFAPRVRTTLESSKADPNEIAEAILRIVNTPAGQRQLRYRIGKGASGVETLNDTAVEVQSQLLAAFGLSDIARFRP